MRDQEIIGLQEAYAFIYTQPVEISEEVEIAAQYFYEMGLNEDGVDILIEELGVEEFVEFVYDIAEEYVLTEARAGGSKIEPKTSKGKPIEGKPTAQSLKALRKKKAARAEAEQSASEAKPSGLKASLKRQSAVAAAAKKQPKKPGVLGRIAGVVNRGIERHNAANKKLNKNLSAAGDAARETGKTISKAAKGVRKVAKGVASGVSGTARLAGHVASRGLGEEIDLFDTILEYLVAEGYADTNKAALAIMANMSEEWKQSIVEGEESKEEPKKPFTGEGPKKPKDWKPTGPKLKTGQRPGYAR